MYKKLCTKCHQPSFSSSDRDKWLCPNCNNDLTHVTPKDAETSQNDRPQLFIIKKDYLEQTPELNAKIKPYAFKSFD
ncbi:hypothetical protein BABA_08696 [Neobacillus bataviensis LMG 21833]|uniref:Uncharacterized protein n=1 Tax=Neobacillus bataviensis LMG 21833 TaxID=1117379 RepID=K6DAF4_9BACI|nr:hypothetical protein [Neobacillus bataviensis]EKN69492.1 hypothetical protein BABA_08696 [Neobacillus bataviensis LMG 21833]